MLFVFSCFRGGGGGCLLHSIKVLLLLSMHDIRMIFRLWEREMHFSREREFMWGFRSEVRRVRRVVRGVETSWDDTRSIPGCFEFGVGQRMSGSLSSDLPKSTRGTLLHYVTPHFRPLQNCC